MKVVKLAPAERAFLESAEFLPGELRETLAAQLDDSRGSTDISLAVDEMVAERLRDVLTEQLARTGFGADYNLITKGEILERLIDAFG